MTTATKGTIKSSNKGFRCFLNLRPNLTVLTINRDDLPQILVTRMPKWKGLHKQSKKKPFAFVWELRRKMEAWTPQGRQLAIYDFKGVVKATELKKGGF